MGRRIAAVLAALLVVLGVAVPAQADPTDGADYSWYRPSVAQLDGIPTVVRYLVPASQGPSGKALTVQEAHWLLAQGKTIVLNYEWYPASARGGYWAGVRDAKLADAARADLVAPPYLPIYLSADWDVQPGELPAVLAYLAGAASVLGHDRVGVYGGYRVVRAALDAGYRWGWQTYAWSWGQWDPRAQLRQTANGALWGGQGDRDRVGANVGGWYIGPFLPGSDDTKPRPMPPTPPPAPLVYVVRRGDTLSRIALANGTSWQQLASLNRLRDPNWLWPGEVLRLRGSPVVVVAPSRIYRVRAGDTLSRIAWAHGTSWQRLASLNRLANPNRIWPGELIRY